MEEEFKKAVAFYEKSKLDEANNICLKIFKLNPDHFDNLRLLNFIYFKKKKYSLAINFINRAIKISPKFAENYNEKGNALYELKKHQAAIECYDKAIDINPKYFDAFYNKGVVLHELKKLEEAIKNYDKALNIKKNHTFALNNKGFALEKLKKFNEALDSYNKVLKIDPNFSFLLGKIIHTKSLLCNWDSFEKNLENLKNQINNNKTSTLPFATLALYDMPKLHKKTAEIWVKKNFENKKIIEPINKYKKNNKIKIGYYSADFHNHATSLLIAEMLELHDKSKFDLFGFSFGPNKNDTMRKRVAKCFNKFLDVRLKSDDEIVQISRNLKIDIAIDLKGITTDERFGIFINRCAPIQVSFLGYPGTSGAKFIDYIIADKTLIPEENQKYFTEKIIYMPNSYQPNDSTKEISEKKMARENFDLPKNSFVFCCFNQNYKITPSIFNIWMKLLKKKQQSVLWLIKDSNEGVINLKNEAKKRGINPDRIIFANRMSVSEHLCRHRLADLFIDTFPYSAHTTCSDSLWSGLPVVTLMGNSFASRVSGSLLRAVGLNNLITKTVTKYENLILELANNPKKLKNIRKKLENNKFKVPLFDTKTYIKNLESSYTKIYQTYHEDKLPKNIFVN